MHPYFEELFWMASGQPSSRIMNSDIGQMNEIKEALKQQFRNKSAHEQ